MSAVCSSFRESLDVLLVSENYLENVLSVNEGLPTKTFLRSWPRKASRSCDEYPTARRAAAIAPALAPARRFTCFHSPVSSNTCKYKTLILIIQLAYWCIQEVCSLQLSRYCHRFKKAGSIGHIPVVL